MNDGLNVLNGDEEEEAQPNDFNNRNGILDAGHELLDEPIMEFKADPESVIELTEEDIAGLYDVINENEETTNLDDECEMTVVDGVFPMPIQVSSDDLVKRKDDWLSNNLPFNNSVSILIIS